MQRTELAERRARARELKVSFDETKASRPADAANAAAAIAAIAIVTPDAEVQALAAWTAGMVALQQTGEPERALQLLDEAVLAFERLGEPEQGAAVQVSRLHALAVLGRYDEAIAAGGEALEALERSGDDLAAGKVEQNLGNIHWRREQYGEAERLLRSARARFERVSSDIQLAQVDNNLAGVLALQYRFAEAEAHYQQARDRAESLGLVVTRAEVMVNLGCLALARGDYAVALAQLEHARRRYTALDLPHKLANAEKELADAYLELNLLPEAADLYEHATPTFRRLGMRAEMGWSEAFHGRALLLMGSTDDARQHLDAARAVFAAEENRVGEAMVLLAEAELFLRSGNNGAAAAAAQEAEELLAAAGAPGRLLLARWLRGEAARRDDSREQARTILSSTLTQAESAQLPHVAHRCLTSLGLLAAADGDAGAAKAAFERAVEVIEALGAPLPAEEFRTAFGADKLVPYIELVRLALTRGTAEAVTEAFDLAERARSRVLADLMAGVRNDAPTDEFERELLARVDRLRQELGWLYGRVHRFDTGDGGRRGNGAVVERIESAVREREAELMQVRRQLAAARKPSAAAGSSGTGELLQLPGGTALIAYFSLDDELLAFVVRDDHVEAVRDLASSAEVDAELRALRFQVGSLSYGADQLRLHLAQLTARAQHRLQRLYDMVLRPLEPHMNEAERLVVVPHHALHYLPFHALHDGRQYVIEHREVAYAPSFSVLRQSLNRPRSLPPRRAVLFGVADSGAPRVREEVERLTSLFPEAEAHLDGSATLGALRAGVPGADVLHLATHGRFRPDNALFSALRLADGWLTVRDACDLNLSGCGLVALSACDTGVSEVAPGDELLGLTRGFFASGAASLLVSLWPVDDAATVELMDCFYRDLRAGAGPAAALRLAQRELLGRYEHPFFWAGFALHGRW